MWCALLRLSVCGTPTYNGSQNSFQKQKMRDVGTTVVFGFFSSPLKKMARCHKSLFWHLNLKKANCRHKSAGGIFPTHTNMLQKHCRVPVLSRAICSGDRSDHWSIAESCDGLIWWARGVGTTKHVLKERQRVDISFRFWWH